MKKKLLQFVSFVIVLVMILPMIPIGVFAAENPTQQQDESGYENTSNTYSIRSSQASASSGSVTDVRGYKKVTSDGSITSGEYTTTLNFTNKVATSNSQTFETLASASTNTRLAQSMSISFAHDENKIYIGVVGKGGTSGSGGIIRDGYALRLGFDPAHPENYVGISLIETDVANPATSGSSKTAVHDANSISYAWSQASRRGIVRSNGSYEWNVQGYSASNSELTTTYQNDLVDGTTRMVYGTGTYNTYPITAMKVVKKTVSGNAISSAGSGHGRTAEQVWTYWEIELDKAKLLAFYNGMTFKNGSAAVADLNTMLYSVSQFYGLPDEYYPQSIWNGSFGSTSGVSHAMQAYTYDRVIFDSSSCNHIYVPEVTPPTCTEEGYTTYTCSECGNAYVDNEVEATGHSYVVSGTKAVCSCGDICSHDFNNTSCKICKISKSTVENCAHTSWLPATCEHPEICADCYYKTRGEARAHNIINIPAKAPTCIAIGWSAYSMCTYDNCDYIDGFAEMQPTRWLEGTTQETINKGDDTSLTQYGQKIYATGKKKYMAADGLMYLDGDRDIYEPYVEVTPNFVNKTGLSGEYYSNSKGSSGVIVNNANIDYTSNLKYYVAQDKDNVYLLIEDYAPFVDANGNGTLDARHESILRNFAYNVRIGFDAENYDRALLVRLENNDSLSLSVVSEKSSADVNSSVVQYAFERYKNDGTPSGEKKNSNYWNASNSVVNQWIARFELKIDKSLVDNAYKLLNDNKSTEFDFSTMFVSVSTRAIRYDASGANPSAYAFYGSYPGAAGTAAGLPENYVPDVIVFGEHKDPNHNCDFTGHDTDERYLVSDDGKGNAVFYHSCKNTTVDNTIRCGAAGATTFTTTYTTNGSGEREYTIVYTEQPGIPNSKFAVNGDVATCTDGGTYYKHCACGVEDRKSEETFTVAALGHDWIDQDKNYRTPRYCPTCDTTDNPIYVTQPSEKKEINLLMIGNSFCYYFVDELYAIANAAGITLNVANLYRSGHSVYGYYNHLTNKNDTTTYELRLTEKNWLGQIKTSTKKSNATLDYALNYKEWDVVTFQQHFYPNMSMNYNQCVSDTLEYANYLFNYVKTKKPNAKLYWQQSWAFQVGYARTDSSGNLVDGTVLTKEVQNHMYRNIKATSELVAKTNGVTLVPSGDAWQIMRDDFGYDGLCHDSTRSSGAGDNYHDGDIGGGQYLNACVWFETITGQSVKGNTWRPSYTLKANIEGLQEAAHKAVAQIYGPAYARHEHEYQNATCTTPKMCVLCGTTEGTAPGHKNAAGTVFTNACTDTTADKYCTVCQTNVKIVHAYDVHDKCTACGKKREGWATPNGINTHYATNVSGNSPTIDGTIGVGEYGSRTRVTPLALSGNNANLASQYMDYYFAYDDEYIYIAIHEVGVSGMLRSNYTFNFGFDLNDVTNYFSFGGYQTYIRNNKDHWGTLLYYTSGSVCSNSGWLNTSDLIEDSAIKKVYSSTGKVLAMGDVLSSTGNYNGDGNACDMFIEFKLSKADIAECMNKAYGTNYTTISDAMWIDVETKGYNTAASESQTFKWVGQNDITGMQSSYSDYDPNSRLLSRDWMPDVVVFGDENTDIEVANSNPCKAGHTLTQHAAKAPTETEHGWEAYEECSVCNYTTYKEIAPYGVFKTGYNRVDITPSVSSSSKLGSFTNVHDELYATCVAVNDGGETIIIISIDMKSISASDYTGIRRKVARATGVHEDNVFISATHTHSTVTFAHSDAVAWRYKSFAAIAESAKAAIADLEDTEIYIGSTTQDELNDLAYVRRYKKETSTGTSFSSRNPGSGSGWTTVADEDNVLQVVRLVRDGEDIVMTNWQAHLAHAVNERSTSISADMADVMRDEIESAGVKVMYLAGASGNINLTPPSGVSNKYEAVAKALAEKTLEIIDFDKNRLEKINSGKIKVSIVEAYQARNADDSDAVVSAATSRNNSDIGDNYLKLRNQKDYTSLRLGAVSFGDFAFITAPYEMFDTNGLYIKTNSPFKMTFILTNAGDELAYMPSAEYYTSTYGYIGYEDSSGVFGADKISQNPYETYTSYFGKNSDNVNAAEDVAAKFVSMLNGLTEHTHNWTPATCTEPKTCYECLATEGSPLGHADSNKDHICDRGCDVPQGEHTPAAANTHICAYCNQRASDCTGGTATCTEQAICTICNEKYGDSSGHITADTDRNHICDREGCNFKVSDCTGGTATCTEQATCTICNEKYGVALGHADVNPKDHVCDNGCNVPQGEHADGNDANHTCDYCGGTVDGDVCVDENTDHVCDECGETISDHEGGTATCTEQPICTVCGKKYGTALGHDWVEATCAAPKTCSVCQTTQGTTTKHTWIAATCSAPKTCSVCEKTIGTALEHTWVDADCDTAKTCSVCQATEGAALGHTWVDANCTAPKTCSVCQATEGEALGHVWNIVDKKAICTVCQAVCSHAFDDGATNCKHCNIAKSVVDVCEHVWLPATCTTPKTCDACGITEGATLAHTEVTDAAVAPTCTNTGLTEGKHCSVCNTVTVAQQSLAALGHVEVVDAAVTPTCTNTGLTKGKHCSVCNTVTVAQQTVAALGHVEVTDAAVAPTCTEAGLTAGKHCSVCNTVTVAQQSVAALGHDYDDDNDATCNTCGDVREIDTDEVTTDEVTTDEVTTDEVTTNEVTTETPTTEEPKTEAPAEDKGCGGSVGVAGLALVVALGTCTAFVAKKKED